MQNEHFEQKIENTFKSMKEKITISESLLNSDFNKRKSSKNIKKYILFASIITVLLLSVICYSNYNNVFNSFPDKGLQTANIKGKISLLDNITVKDKGISLSAKGIISDETRTVIQVAVEGKLSGKGIPELREISLHDKDGVYYDTYTRGGGGEESSSKKLSEETRVEFEGGPTKDTILTLNIKSINGINGDWLLKIPVKSLKTNKKIINKKIKQNNYIININSVTFAATQTIIEGTIENTKTNLKPIYKVSISNGTSMINRMSGQEGFINDKKLNFITRFEPLDLKNNVNLKIELGCPDSTNDKIKDIDKIDTLNLTFDLPK